MKKLLVAGIVTLCISPATVIAGQVYDRNGNHIAATFRQGDGSWTSSANGLRSVHWQQPCGDLRRQWSSRELRRSAWQSP
jgi:hypothetical protein